MSYRHVGNIIMDTHVINFDALQARGKNMDTDVIGRPKVRERPGYLSGTNPFDVLGCSSQLTDFMLVCSCVQPP